MSFTNVELHLCAFLISRHGAGRRGVSRPYVLLRDSRLVHRRRDAGRNVVGSFHDDRRCAIRARRAVTSVSRYQSRVGSTWWTFRPDMDKPSRPIQPWLRRSVIERRTRRRGSHRGGSGLIERRRAPPPRGTAPGARTELASSRLRRAASRRAARGQSAGQGGDGCPPPS
jgi:hypothetical protein